MDAATNPSPGFARNPSKVIDVTPQPSTVTVYADGIVVARSSRAKSLNEPPYPAAIYIPFADIHFDRLKKTAHSTHCPYKGDASYWSVPGEKGKDAMWAYEHPFDEMTQIANHGAFYPDRVRIVTEA